MNQTETAPGFLPRTFALRGHPAGDAPVIVAFGMTLPDGSAVTTTWPPGSCSVTSLCNSAQSAAKLHNAELVWLTQPTPARGASR